MYSWYKDKLGFCKSHKIWFSVEKVVKNIAYFYCEYVSDHLKFKISKTFINTILSTEKSCVELNKQTISWQSVCYLFYLIYLIY